MSKEVKKVVYFVRHGESSENALNVYQTEDTELSERGSEETGSLTKRLQKLPIDIILASTMVRAKQTAEIVNDVLKKKIEFNELFIEVKKPTVLIGMDKKSKETQEIVKLIRDNEHKEGWRHSDEENFQDRNERAKRIIELLQDHEENHILIVTHGKIIKTIVAYMLFGDEMTANECYRFLDFATVKNTGITVCNLLNNDRWQLVHWNDIAHLESEN